MAWATNRALNRADRDFRERGMLAPRERTVAMKWEDERKSTLLGWDRMTAFLVYGVDVMSWNLTNQAIVLIPFSAGVVGCEPPVIRLPFKAGYHIVAECVRRPFSQEVEGIGYLSAWKGEQFVYRGEFCPPGGLKSTNFYSALRGAAGSNFDLFKTTVDTEGVFAPERFVVESAAMGMKITYSLLPVSGGYRWIVDFDLPVPASDVSDDAMAEIQATAAGLAGERQLSNLVLTLRHPANR